jgi:microcystin degradation protein MlrC
MARRKIVISMMMHEIDTFSPVPTPLESFRPLAGEAAIAEFRATNTQLGGFLDVVSNALDASSPAQGIPGIDRVMTDNGSAYVSRPLPPCSGPQ